MDRHLSLYLILFREFFTPKFFKYKNENPFRRLTDDMTYHVDIPKSKETYKNQLFRLKHMTINIITIIVDGKELPTLTVWTKIDV